MLVLSRKQDERIVITNTATGEKIIATIVRMNAVSVRIGIDAPENYKILREELIIEPK